MKKALLGAAVALAFSASAHAGPFYINTGVDFGGNGSTTTSDIAELGYTGTLATSIYLADPTVGANVTVIDTNIQSVMDAYGFDTIDGTNGFDYAAPDQRNVDSLNQVTGTTLDTNGFRGLSEDWGDAGRWGIVYDYFLLGAGNIDDGALFGSGYFDIFYTTDPTASVKTQIARLNVTGTEPVVGDQFKYTIFGNVTFDWNGIDGDDTTTDFQRNFFVDAETDKTFYELWLGNISAPLNLAVQWELDTNINSDGTAPANNLGGVAEVAHGEDETAYMRQTTLDGSIVFNVPEPMSLALIGLGLLGIGATRRLKMV